MTTRCTDSAQPLTGSEDFSRVLNEVPGAYLLVGASTTEDPGDSATNHSPLAAFDDSVLPDNAALLASLAVQRIAKG